jgi:ribosome-associated toxin RatA of RatAB toxin-antitoxin module
MIQIDRSALVGYRAQDMYALAEDIESYPQFLPWCDGAEYASREADRTVATLHINFHGFTSQFTTENTHHPGSRIDMKLVSGPFRSLQGSWSFTDLGNDASKVAFSLRYEFKSPLLEAAVGRVFRGIAETFVEAFVRRADEKFGRK